MLIKRQVYEKSDPPKNLFPVTIYVTFSCSFVVSYFVYVFLLPHGNTNFVFLTLECSHLSTN